MTTPPQPSTPKTVTDAKKSFSRRWAYGYIGEFNKALDDVIEDALTTHSLSILKALEKRQTKMRSEYSFPVDAREAYKRGFRDGAEDTRLDIIVTAKELLTSKN